jgi:hypothetical protein
VRAERVWAAWVAVGVLGSLFIGVTAAHAFLPGYGDRISITCGGQNPPASSLTDFTCIVRLSDAATPGNDVVPNFNYAHVQSSATCGPTATGTTCDVRFTDGSDNELPFKIEKWNGATDHICTAGNCSTLKVKTGVGTSGTTIYMYYNNASPSADTNVNSTAAYDGNTKVALSLSDSSGTTAADDVGLHDGVYHASPTQDVAGQVDGAVSLNGSTQWVTMGASSDFYPSAMTMSLWVKPNATISTISKLVAKQSSTDNSYQFRFLANGTLQGALCNTLACPAFICEQSSSGIAPASGTWAHVAMVWSGGTGNSSITLYKDGQVVSNTACGAGTFTALAQGTQRLGLGSFSDGSSQFLNAVIDNFLFDSTARSAAWIKALYNAGRGAFNTSTAEEVPTATATATATQTDTPTATATATVTETATATVTATATATLTATATETATASATATATATETSTPTSSPTESPSATPSATPTQTPSATRSSTPTGTPSSTPGNTATTTQTRTVTNTPTVTPTIPVAPAISGGVQRGGTIVTGTGQPRPTPNTCIDVCLASPSGQPQTPPCPPGTILGTGGTNAAGAFVSGSMPGIPLSRPLSERECVYAFDVCEQLVGPVACVEVPAAAPALEPWMLLPAAAMLALLGGIGIARRRWTDSDP